MAGKDIFSQVRKGIDMAGRAEKKRRRAGRQAMRAKRKYQKGDVAGGDRMAGKAKKSVKGTYRAGRKAAGSTVRIGRPLQAAGTAALSGNYAGAGLALGAGFVE
tara:strand:- start:659 stop:970 length:312 start_codon:yes stop_codon:yes gene_type:complete